ncbi:glutathione S-transferase [Motilimonas sp. E26]|uniref:glutathione S-transferase n=1 Tax=Motilimonas TaxID=1914248 RepID=UPI001E39D3FD|nr:glutathione S-transferase [Motilimonas sp. E26]MCE0555371.1 glutathione S-transferase [Motilimonas sp. E26]
MTAILYSFRRCPYAMRARLAIAASGQSVSLREIELKHKPEQMLAISPKGTVPVLLLENGDVLEESIDIMHWALNLSDPLKLLPSSPALMQGWIKRNDLEFKGWLDKYKYADRYPEHDEAYYREQACLFIAELEQQLSQTHYILGQQLTMTDLAIAPFIRQFSMVDAKWFANAPYPHLRSWLEQLINSRLFLSVMKKYPTWLNSQESFSFP